MDLLANAQKLVDAGLPWVQQYGLWLVALGAFGQAIPMFALLVPGFAVSLAAGYFCASGAFSFPQALLAASAGALSGLCLTFFLGRRVGLRDKRSRLNIRDRVQAALEHEGKWMLLYYVYATPVRHSLPFVAGAQRFSWPVWIGLNMLAVVPWMALQLSIGLFARAALHSEHALAYGLALALMFALSVGATVFVTRRVLGLGKPPPADAGKSTLDV